MLKALWIAVLVVLVGFGTARAAPILQIDGSGKVTGAKGVDVGGTLYDVEFVDGTCIAVFSGCNDPADFIFSGGAAAASAALLAQVFLDFSPTQLFDTHPELTFGCSTSSVNPCLVYTPEFINVIGNVHVSLVRNTNGTTTDTSNLTANLAPTTATATNEIFARWTLSPEDQAAPIPGTIALLGVALAGLGWSRRRK